MNQLLLNNFKDHVVTHYSDCKLSTKSICSDLHCSISHLHRILVHNYGYSIMRYVKYFRILKSIELTYYNKEKKVYHKVGYRLYNSFYKTFHKVTKLHVSFFCPSRFKENKEIAIEVYKTAKENPEKAIELIINDISKRYILKNSEMARKSTKMSK